MFPVALGSSDVGEWKAWYVPRHTRKNSRRTARAADGSPRPQHSRSSLATSRTTCRGLGLARIYSQWTDRVLQPKAPAPKCATLVRCSPVRALQPTTHVPDAPRGVRLRCLDARPDRRVEQYLL